MKITFIGIGKVGSALANRLAHAGHEVIVGHEGEESASVSAALARNPKLSTRAPAAAVAWADAVFLATPYAAVEGVVAPLAEALAGKIIVDCTNPVGPGLSHGLQSRSSGSEAIQALAPKARVVKAFTIYGYENLEDASYGSLRPAMLFCGDDQDAKARVGGLIDELGFEPVDVGALVQALHLEHMTLLWVRMVRAGGASPHLVWAALRR